MQVSQVEKHKNAESVSEKPEESEAMDAKARDLKEELRLVRAEKVGFFILLSQRSCFWSSRYAPKPDIILVFHPSGGEGGARVRLRHDAGGGGGEGQHGLPVSLRG